MDEKLIDLLHEITDLINQNNIHCWLDQGFLLGGYRDGKMLDGDDDVDFGIREQDVPQLLEALKTLKGKGYEIWFEPSNIYVRKNEGTPITFAIYQSAGWVFYANIGCPAYTRLQQNLETLYGFAKHPDVQLRNGRSADISRWLIKSRFVRWWVTRTYRWVWQNVLGGKPFIQATRKYFYDSPLSKLTVYGCEFKIPQKTEEYLAFKYGEKWMEPNPDWNYCEQDGGVITGRALSRAFILKVNCV